MYCWAAALETDPHAMNGLFRHAFALGKLFCPAIVLSPAENVPKRGIARLRATLNKAIVSISDPHEIKDAIWVTLGVDQISPTMPLMDVLRVTILHDAMSGYGLFGPDARDRFCFGAHSQQVFLYTTNYALNSFKATCTQLGIKTDHKIFIPYGCFHTCDELPFSLGQRDPYTSLSVHSLFRRKNLDDVLKLVEAIQTRHVHIGNRGDLEPEEYRDVSSLCRWIEHCPDEALYAYYAQVSHFICMSRDEGFSMPALEAIIYGVPHIHLSPIVAHLEIYGHLSVNFHTLPFSPSSKVITEDERVSMFEKYKFGNIVKPFQDFVCNQY